MTRVAAHEAYSTRAESCNLHLLLLLRPRVQRGAPPRKLGYSSPALESYNPRLLKFLPVRFVELMNCKMLYREPHEQCVRAMDMWGQVGSGRVGWAGVGSGRNVASIPGRFR